MKKKLDMLSPLTPTFYEYIFFHLAKIMVHLKAVKKVNIEPLTCDLRLLSRLSSLRFLCNLT